MSDSPLWTSEEAMAATAGRSELDWRAYGVSIDSRTLSPGDLFVALKGDNRDGHRFVDQAFEAGACAAMVSRVPRTMQETYPILVVADTLDGLNGLARHARGRTQAKIIAVTGSVGKTGTKEALRRVLSAQGATHASSASYNNHWGVPLSMARMPKASDYGIFEIGMNHPGEIAPLTSLVRPHVAVVTTVEAVHLEFFKNIDAIADAKAEIFEGVESGGAAIINADNAYYARLASHARNCGVSRIISFGETAGSDARLLALQSRGESSVVEADICGERVRFQLNIPGRHHAMNSLAVLAAVKALGADVAQAACGLSDMAAHKGRGQRHTVETAHGEFALIDESYNASPASMRAAIETLGQAMCRGRRVVVLGDMLELGAQGPAFHAELAEVIAHARIDLVYLCGPLMRYLWNALPESRRGAYAPDSKSLAGKVAGDVRADDIVMVKGSLGSRMTPIVDTILALADSHEEGEFPLPTEELRGV